MANTETLNVTLPAEMVAQMHAMVAAGMYASSDELVGAALDRLSQQLSAGLEEDVEGIRRALQEVNDDDGPGIPMDEVFDRLEAKFRALAAEAERPK